MILFKMFPKAIKYQKILGIKCKEWLLPTKDKHVQKLNVKKSREAVIASCIGGFLNRLFSKMLVWQNVYLSKWDTQHDSISELCSLLKIKIFNDLTILHYTKNSRIKQYQWKLPHIDFYIPRIDTKCLTGIFLIDTHFIFQNFAET